MTNFEKYKDDLMKIEGDFAFDRNTEKIVRCDNCINCGDCMFNSTGCLDSDKIYWLCKEHRESILSNGELELIKALNKAMGKEYKYIARDTTRNIRFFETKPNRNVLKNYYNLVDGYTYMGIQYGLLFPNIKFEDGLYDIENKCFIKV